MSESRASLAGRAVKGASAGVKLTSKGWQPEMAAERGTPDSAPKELVAQLQADLAAYPCCQFSGGILDRRFRCGGWPVAQWTAERLEWIF